MADLVVTSALPVKIAAPSGVDLVSYFHRAWPPIALAAALMINTAWIGLLAYGAFELGERVF
jgi:hypothetical protein